MLVKSLCCLQKHMTIMLFTAEWSSCLSLYFPCYREEKNIKFLKFSVLLLVLDLTCPLTTETLISKTGLYSGLVYGFALPN